MAEKPFLLRYNLSPLLSHPAQDPSSKLLSQVHKITQFSHSHKYSHYYSIISLLLLHYVQYEFLNKSCGALHWFRIPCARGSLERIWAHSILAGWRDNAVRLRLAKVNNLAFEQPNVINILNTTLETNIYFIAILVISLSPLCAFWFQGQFYEHSWDVHIRPVFYFAFDTKFE